MNGTQGIDYRRKPYWEKAAWNESAPYEVTHNHAEDLRKFLWILDDPSKGMYRDYLGAINPHGIGYTAPDSGDPYTYDCVIQSSAYSDPRDPALANKPVYYPGDIIIWHPGTKDLDDEEGDWWTNLQFLQFNQIKEGSQTVPPPPNGGIDAEDNNEYWVRTVNPYRYHHYDKNAHRYIISNHATGSWGSDTWDCWVSVFESWRLYPIQVDPRERIEPAYYDDADRYRWRNETKTEFISDHLTQVSMLGPFRDSSDMEYKLPPSYSGPGSLTHKGRVYYDRAGTQYGIYEQEPVCELWHPLYEYVRDNDRRQELAPSRGFGEESPIRQYPGYANPKLGSTGTWEADYQSATEAMADANGGRYVYIADEDFRENWERLYGLVWIDGGNGTQYDPDGNTYDNWATATVYNPGDIVLYDSNSDSLKEIWVCDTNHTSSAANEPGTTVDVDDGEEAYTEYVFWQRGVEQNQYWYLNNELWGCNDSAFEVALKLGVGEWDWYLDTATPYTPKWVEHGRRFVAWALDYVGTVYWKGLTFTSEEDIETKLPRVKGTWRRTWKYSCGRIADHKSGGIMWPKEMGDPPNYTPYVYGESSTYSGYADLYITTDIKLGETINAVQEQLGYWDGEKWIDGTWRNLDDENQPVSMPRVYSEAAWGEWKASGHNYLSMRHDPIATDGEGDDIYECPWELIYHIHDLLWFYYRRSGSGSGSTLQECGVDFLVQNWYPIPFAGFLSKQECINETMKYLGPQEEECYADCKNYTVTSDYYDVGKPAQGFNWKNANPCKIMRKLGCYRDYATPLGYTNRWNPVVFDLMGAGNSYCQWHAGRFVLSNAHLTSIYNADKVVLAVRATECVAVGPRGGSATPPDSIGESSDYGCALVVDEDLTLTIPLVWPADRYERYAYMALGEPSEYVEGESTYMVLWLDQPWHMPGVEYAYGLDSIYRASCGVSVAIDVHDPQLVIFVDYDSIDADCWLRTGERRLIRNGVPASLRNDPPQPDWPVWKIHPTVYDTNWFSRNHSDYEPDYSLYMELVTCEDYEQESITYQFEVCGVPQAVIDTPPAALQSVDWQTTAGFTIDIGGVDALATWRSDYNLDVWRYRARAKDASGHVGFWTPWRTVNVLAGSPWPDPPEWTQYPTKLYIDTNNNGTKDTWYMQMSASADGHPLALPVEYFFEVTGQTAGEVNSSWQESGSYMLACTGEPDDDTMWRVKARDKTYHETSYTSWQYIRDGGSALP